MARISGQIDVAKSEAILDAAIEVLAERGVSASMDEIARRAGVSKQTIYNHYGSKAELVRIMSARRVHEITASLVAPVPPVEGAPDTAITDLYVIDGAEPESPDVVVQFREPFTFAGTMFASPGGTAPLAGGSFHLIDALGTDTIVETQSNGNFYSMGLVTFPVIAFRALCPDVVRMQSPISAFRRTLGHAGRSAVSRRESTVSSSESCRACGRTAHASRET